MLDYLNQILPLKIENIKKGVGSFIIFNFETNDTLWVYLSDWNIFDLNLKKVLINSDFINNTNYINIFKQISLYPLSKIMIQNEVVKFYFSDKYLLELTKDLKSYDADDELFMLFLNNESKVISFSPKNKFVLEDSEDSLLN